MHKDDGEEKQWRKSSCGGNAVAEKQSWWKSSGGKAVMVEKQWLLDDTDERMTDRPVPLVTRVTNGAPLFDDSPMGLYDYMIDHWNCRPL
jgi:hypothetical protein